MTITLLTTACNRILCQIPCYIGYIKLKSYNDMKCKNSLHFSNTMLIVHCKNHSNFHSCKSSFPTRLRHRIKSIWKYDSLSGECNVLIVQCIIYNFRSKSTTIESCWQCLSLQNKHFWQALNFLRIFDIYEAICKICRSWRYLYLQVAPWNGSNFVIPSQPNGSTVFLTWN